MTGQPWADPNHDIRADLEAASRMRPSEPYPPMFRPVPPPRGWLLLLPYQAPPLSLNDRRHRMVVWRAQHNLTEQVRLLARAQRIGRLDRIHVQLHYLPATRRTRDADNLVATLKPCIDGLRDAPARFKGGRMVAAAQAGIVVDDDPAHVRWSPPEIHAPVKQHTGSRLWLVITEASDAGA